LSTLGTLKSQRALAVRHHGADSPQARVAAEKLATEKAAVTVERLVAEAPGQPPPWLAKLSPESRAAIAAGVAEWPELTERQRERLRLLFRPRPAELDTDDGAA
jgi:hypothetical protein